MQNMGQDRTIVLSKEQCEELHLYPGDFFECFVSVLICTQK